MALILVADDEPAIRGLISAALRSAGHEVLEAQDGLQALSVFRSHPERIELVITDIVMPGLNGRDLVQRIRESGADTAFICITGFADIEVPEGVLFVRKPFGIPALLKMVAGALKAPPPRRRERNRRQLPEQ